MAKVKGPLHSLNARGNWSKGTVQFRGGLRATHAYRPAPPGTVNQAPASEAQTAVRDRYHSALEAWRALSPEERALWNFAAETDLEGISGWNLFMRAFVPAPSTGPLDLLIGSPPRALSTQPAAARHVLTFANFLE